MYPRCKACIHTSAGRTLSPQRVRGRYYEDMGERLQSMTEPIDEVIARAVAVDSLHLEEITPADLNSLLQRLHRSVALVQEALKHLSDQHIQNPK